MIGDFEFWLIQERHREWLGIDSGNPVVARWVTANPDPASAVPDDAQLARERTDTWARYSVARVLLLPPVDDTA